MKEEVIKITDRLHEEVHAYYEYCLKAHPENMSETSYDSFRFAWLIHKIAELEYKITQLTLGATITINQETIREFNTKIK